MSRTAAPALDIEYLRLARAVDPNVDRNNQRWALDLPSPSGSVFTRRHEMVKRFSWAIPNEAAVQAIAALSPIVEIGAGTGYWAHLLTQAGADVVAYDKAPGFNTWCEHEPYFPIQVGSWQQVRQHPAHTLFLCWPYMNNLAAKCLLAYRGDRVVYIGEGQYGCTANDLFFTLLERDWVEARHITIPQWWGLNDSMTIYERKAGDGRRAMRV